jgi:hypothetical protein
MRTKYQRAIEVVHPFLIKFCARGCFYPHAISLSDD